MTHNATAPDIDAIANESFDIKEPTQDIGLCLTHFTADENDSEGFMGLATAIHTAGETQQTQMQELVAEQTRQTEATHELTKAVLQVVQASRIASGQELD